MISGQVGETIPAACQDWANTKAAYRFLSNDRVSEAEILGGHFHATADRIGQTTGPLLVLHDTTECSYERSGSSDLGLIGLSSTGKDKEGRPRHHTVLGILMHSSMVVSPEGLRLGLAAIKCWNRKKFTGCNALKGKTNRKPCRKLLQNWLSWAGTLPALQTHLVEILWSGVDWPTIKRFKMASPSEPKWSPTNIRGPPTRS